MSTKFTALEIDRLLKILCKNGIDVNIDFISDCTPPWSILVEDWSRDPFLHIRGRGLTLLEALQETVILFEKEKNN